MGRKKLVAGNWKMNGSLAANAALIGELLAGIGQPACDVAVCVPAVYLAQVQLLLAGQGGIALGAQDVSQHESGAYTGDVSAAMLKELGARYVIVGHSERRQYQGETDAQVAVKAQRALAAGLTPIVCVGETLREREQGETESVVSRQLSAVIQLNGERLADLVVAYEPGPLAQAELQRLSRRRRYMPHCAPCWPPPICKRRVCASSMAAA